MDEIEEKVDLNKLTVMESFAVSVGLVVCAPMAGCLLILTGLAMVGLLIVMAIGLPIAAMHNAFESWRAGRERKRLVDKVLGQR